MMIKDLKKKRGELGVVLNTFDVEKLTEYIKTTDLFKESYKDNFLKSSEERRTMFMCFMIIDQKAPKNVYPITKRKAKELISKKFMEEQFNAAKKKVDAREEKENDDNTNQFDIGFCNRLCLFNTLPCILQRRKVAELQECCRKSKKELK